MMTCLVTLRHGDPIETGNTALLDETYHTS